MANYLSFEDVMRKLGVTEEELKRLVREGKLLAYRDENRMKFKEEDVKIYKKACETS